MEILYVRGCPYEDNEGEVLNLHVRLEEGETLAEGGNIRIEMMDDSVIEREIKIINPKWAGDYAPVSKEAKQWKQSGETLKEIKGPGEWDVVVMNVPYHEVKTPEEIRQRAAMDDFMAEMDGKVCISPFREIECGGESIYDHVKEGYSVPDKVIAYLQTKELLTMSLGLYEHPFKPGKDLTGPYWYTDGHYFWDRDTWKYVLKYHVTLPQEFIDHVMSDAGTAFLKEQTGKDDSWAARVREWKGQENTLCLLPEDAGNLELEDF
ncbi:MAG: hypothetical protein NC121_07340 [Blautia sp.]|nr:hypothetical protein [Blautia sp.]